MQYLATSKRNGEGESGLGLDAVVAECAQVIQNTAITAAGISECARTGKDALVAKRANNIDETRHNE